MSEQRGYRKTREGLQHCDNFQKNLDLDNNNLLRQTH